MRPSPTIYIHTYIQAGSGQAVYAKQETIYAALVQINTLKGEVNSNSYLIIKHTNFN
jgi:hypothetical protein